MITAASQLKVVPRIAFLSLCVFALLSAATYLNFQSKSSESLERIIAEQHSLLIKDNELIATELRETISALQILLQRAEELGAPPAEALRSAIFANRAAFQARWLSLDGQELVRFDRNGDEIAEVSRQKLQDKSDRDYFRSMRDLEVGQIYISEFNLNVEQGTIEVPFRPTVRIGLRATRGFILANLNLAHLFALIRTPQYSLHETWLINRQGDWLIAPEQSMEWGFQLGEPVRIWDTLSFPNLEQLISGESWSSIAPGSGDILLASSLNLGPTSPSQARLEDDHPIILRLIPRSFVDEYIGQRHLIQPALAYLLALLLSFLIYVLLIQWRRRVVSDASTLVKSEELDRLFGIANLLPQMTWTTTSQGYCDFVNSRWESYTGVPEIELVGTGWFQFVHPEDRERVQGAWERCLLTGEDFSHHFRIRDEAGNYRMFDTRAHALKDSNGQVIKWFGSNTDVQSAIDLAERVEDEKRILESNLAELLKEKRELLRRFEFAASSANLGVWELDLSRHHLVWDDRMFSIFGQHRSPKHNIYRLWKESIHPDDLSEIEAKLAYAAQELQNIHLEYRVMRPDGKTIWVRDDASVQHSANRSRVKLIGCSQDITAYKNLTLSLEEALAHLEQARKVAGIGIFRIVLAQKRSEWSSEVFSLLGLPKQSNFSLQRLLQYIVPEQRDRIELDYQTAIARHEPYDAYIQIRTPLGDTRFLHLFLDAIVDETGDDLVIYGVLLDVSEQKEVEIDLEEARSQAESSNLAKSAFLANISHEIRTPMNGILGMLALLQKRTREKESANLVDKALHAAERLMGILNDVLDISRADAGKLTLNKAEIEIDSLLQESVDIFSTNAELKGVAFEVEVAPSLPFSLKVDGLRLGQVISNLVGNALKFTDKGGRVLARFELDQLSQTPQLKVSIIDTGIGMTEEQAARAFDEFNQADDSISKRYGGTGLGLSICKRLTELMRGQIKLSSRPGNGTTATLHVPFEFVAPASSSQQNLHSCQVDLVTLNQTLERSLRPALVASGVSLRVFSSVDELVESAKDPAAIWRHLLIDSMYIEGPTGEAFAARYDELRPQLQEYTSQTLFLPPLVSTSLRIQLGSGTTRLIYGNITATGIERLLRNSMSNRPPDPAVRSVVGTEKKLSNLKIISVDDVELNNDVIKGLLAQYNAEVELFTDARKAIARIKQGGVDLVLMDVHMPDMDGLEATRQIRELAESLQPLIFGLSASVLPEDRAKGLAAGMDEYLNKPFRINELITILNVDVDDSDRRMPDTKPARVSTYDWPEFIDREMALKQTSGDEAALLNLARAFVTGFTTYPSEYAEAVDTRDASQLELLTHRVKGASAYIGDTEVHELAKTLELEVKNGKLPTGNELGDLVGEHIKQLQPLLAEIRTESVKAISSSELEQVTSELLAAYSDNCFTPPNEWKPYVAGLRAEGFDSMAKELEQALEVNDFNSAASILTEIRAAIEKRAQKR